MIPNYEIVLVKNLEPLRGPSGKLWPVLSSYLYDEKYFYQICINEVYCAMPLLELLETYNLRTFNTTQMIPYSECNILGFKIEPPEDLVTELKLRFA